MGKVFSSDEGIKEPEVQQAEAAIEAEVVQVMENLNFDPCDPRNIRRDLKLVQEETKTIIQNLDNLDRTMERFFHDIGNQLIYLAQWVPQADQIISNLSTRLAIIEAIFTRQDNEVVKQARETFLKGEMTSEMFVEVFQKVIKPEIEARIQAQQKEMAELQKQQQQQQEMGLLGPDGNPVINEVVSMPGTQTIIQEA